jgi:hypothetical protein
MELTGRHTIGVWRVTQLTPSERQTEPCARHRRFREAMGLRCDSTKTQVTHKFRTSATTRHSLSHLTLSWMKIPAPHISTFIAMAHGARPTLYRFMLGSQEIRRTRMFSRPHLAIRTTPSAAVRSTQTLPRLSVTVSGIPIRWSWTKPMGVASISTEHCERQRPPEVVMRLIRPATCTLEVAAI